MGNVLSSSSTRERAAPSVSSECETMAHQSDENPFEVFHEALDENFEDRARIEQREKEMLEFHKQLNAKREQRKEILARHRAEKEELQKALVAEQKSKAEVFNVNRQLRELLLKNDIEIPEDLPTFNDNVELSETISQMREEFECIRSSNIKLRQDLASSNVALQSAYSEMAELSAQNAESFKHISALKDVVNASKTMISLREQQLNELKNKLSDIEKSLADREASMLSADLRQEYERQLQNIRTLRTLYEERARLAEISKQNLTRELAQQKQNTETEIKKNTDLMEKVDELETKVEELEDIIENKNNEIATNREETQILKSEILVVNKLFSQVLLGYKTKQDLDKLVHRLEENHGLLTQMAENANDSEASSALPKLLLELVSQVDEIEKTKNTEVEEENSGKPENPKASCSTTPEEIVEKLPKVWKVLMELLSHQTVTEDNSAEKITTCYKSVETKSGPVLVPSVSQTYIRLKDLIVEKLSLVKEVNRIKQLNSHLETRLEAQEHRLCHVTKELSKTWHVVGRLRKHHHQLHTHEKILKYELQQKRKLLNELKEELEYCREKWEQAREKNSQSEKDWTKLRAEFTQRNTATNQDSFNSAESGFSDNRPTDESSESNDESEYTVEPLMRKRKSNKTIIDQILDANGDCNLTEERDQASDLIDVSDLPSENHDAIDNKTSNKSDTDNEQKTETLSEVSEDEVGVVTTACIDNADRRLQQTNQILDLQNNLPIVSFDAAAILKSISEQNERLARKDKKLESLEKNGNSLLKKTQDTINLSEQINNTLDHIIHRPCSSRDCGNVEVILANDDTKNQDHQISENQTTENLCVENQNDTSDDFKADTSGNIDCKPCLTNTDPVSLTPLNVDFKAILENIQLQNERLKKKDERLETMEKECDEVVEKLTNTVNVVSEEIKEKIETLHNEYSNDSISNFPEPSTCMDIETTEEDRTSRSGSEPSNSSDIDHKAVFAARDRRLKRLEEQTKSLVKKMNKTTCKGVKINYKLEELHNIYGSESSRAGTPCDDSKSDEATESNTSQYEKPDEPMNDQNENAEEEKEELDKKEDY